MMDIQLKFDFFSFECSIFAAFWTVDNSFQLCLCYANQLFSFESKPSKTLESLTCALDCGIIHYKQPFNIVYDLLLVTVSSWEQVLAIILFASIALYVLDAC